MEADTGLTYSSINWQEALKLFDRIKDNRSKMALEPYPDEKVLAAFAKLAYSDCTGELVLPKGWQLLTTAQSKSRTNGYFGCAVWSPSQQQVVIAHRGTDPKKLGAIWIDGKGVYCNKYTNHMSSAVSFADEVKKVILETNQRYGSRFGMSFTGHSLGAWLAGVTTMTVKHLKREGSCFRRITSPGEGLHAHTLALDSPGVEDMLIKICRDYSVRYDRSMCTRQLDITTFFAAPNLVNSTGFHVGGLRQIHIERVSFPSDSEEPTLMCNIDTHNIDKFIKAFKDGKETYVVQNWPHGFDERKYYHELEMFCNSYVLHLDAVQVPPASSNGSYQNTDPVEGHTGGLHLEKIPILQYRTIPSQGNTCHLGVFSAEEFNFIKNWSLFQSNALKLTKIEKFLFHKNLMKLDIPKFEIDTRRNTVTCETREHLGKVIGQIKLLLRWFPVEISDAMTKQNRSIKSAPLYMAGQAYLRTLPDILDCEDTLGLEPFLDSSDQRVLQIESTDLKFEAARIYNILVRIKNATLHKIYLKEDCHTFLGWNEMVSIAEDVNIEGLSKSHVTNDNLLILEFVSPTDNLHPNYGLFRKILRNLETCSHKKLVIIVLSQPIDSQLFMDHNLTVETKPFKVFELSDLTLTSREEILARNAIALGEEPLSLNKLLGDVCKSQDKQVQMKINQLISPILKNLAADHQYILKIPNKLPRLCELDALYSKGNKRVNKARLAALLQTTGDDGPLLVISDPEQLSPEDCWGEVAESARRRIFTSAADGHDLFLEKCREELVRVIYLFHLCPEGFTLREVYNLGLFMPRKFHTRLIIKSIDAFVRHSGFKDLFIISNAMDKASLIRSFKLSREAAEFFTTNVKFQIRSPSQELNIKDEIKEESFNTHYFKMLKIGGSPCLVWQYSHGSLDGLRPFITRDYSDPIEEDAFCNTRKKLTIIADDPGVGKTTSLMRMSELIRGSWVLRIDHKLLTSAIDKLPSKLNLQSVTNCLIHASGLPSDGLVCSLLQHCLRSDNSRQVCVLLDAFDEIFEEKTKRKMIELLKYLKNTTMCKTVVTTRVYPQEGLENDLAEFSAVLEKITESEQEDYMVNFWLPHLALELPEHGEPEKGRLRQFARELREEVEGVLGEDVTSFMGIPLQIRMLAEVFLRQAILSVVSPEQAQNRYKITNLFDLYKQFIEVKKSIFFEQKTNLNQLLPPSIQNDMVTNLMEKHCVLAFQALDPKFAAEYFTKQIQTLSDQVLKDISRLGLIRAISDGTFPFIHRTFEEYFCADFLVQWLRQRGENNRLVKNEFAKYLLRPDYFIIRKFIETQLDNILPIPGDALENNPIMYQHWSDHRQQLFHDRDQTPLHVAAEEQNRHTVAVLLSGPSSRTSEEAYISFVAARDKAGRTALNIALENGNLNIVKQFVENVESCSYESLLEFMLATFLDTGGDRHDDLLWEYCLNTQQLSNANKAFIRTKHIREQFVTFIAAVRDDDCGTVQKILSGMESDTEKAYLLIAIDGQGNTAINLATSKKDHKMFKLLAKHGVCVSYDKLEQNPLHCAAEKGHNSIVKYLLNQSKETYDSIEKTSLLKYIHNKAISFLQQFINDDNHPNEAAKHKILSSINSHDKNGNTALILAAEKGNEEVVGILLQHGMNISSRNHYGLTALSLAAFNGHHEVVVGLLEHGADINSIDNNANTALIFSSENGHREVVNVLLQHGGDVCHRNSIGVNALLKAVFKGHQEIVSLLLQHGADISCKNQFGFNALSLAAFKGHRELVSILLHHRADINCENSNGVTALIFAAQRGHTEVVGTLLQQGADINHRNHNGDTALTVAAYKGHLHVMSILLQHGVDINTKTNPGRTAVIISVQKGHQEASIINRSSLQHGGDINARNINGETPLIVAAKRGHQDAVSILLQHGADINARNNNGDTPLIVAAQKDHQETVSILLQHGADINARNTNDNTPLMFAAQKGNQEIVSIMLQHGVDINSRNINGNTALIITAGKGHHEMVSLLLQHGADIGLRNNSGNTALSWAASFGNLETLCKLLSYNRDNISSQDNNGHTALAWAIFNRHHEIVGELLEHGADIHERCKLGWTALNYAAGYGHLDIVEFLLLKGVDLNSRDKDGDSALLQAAANGHGEIVALLLQRGVDVNSQRDDGRTALSWAALKGRVNVVEVLLQHDADVSCQDKDGKTAFSWAEENGHREVVDLLRSHQEANPMK